MAEAVGGGCKEKIPSFPHLDAPSVEIREITTAEETAMGPTHGAVGRDC